MRKILLLSIIVMFSAKSQALNVTYLSQTINVTPYWHKVYSITKKAAKSLGINLTILEGQGHRIYQMDLIAELSKMEIKPDLLIFHAYPLTSLRTFNILEEAKISFVTISDFENETILPIDRQVGLPQVKFKYWLAEHAIDDSHGAFLLANNLIKQAEEQSINQENSGKKHKLKMLAISGDFIHESIERSKGVLKSTSQNNNVVLVQNINANWEYESAKSKFKALYSRHKGIDVVWASSDLMALGALQGAIELGLTPNIDIFIGGFDWDHDAIEKIKQRQLSASAGGQFYNIAWLLVRIYDHFNNQSLFSKSTAQVTTDYTIIDQTNLARYEKLIDVDKFIEIDFRCFSKTYTKESTYDFSLDKLLKQVEQPNQKKCL